VKIYSTSSAEKLSEFWIDIFHESRLFHLHIYKQIRIEKRSMHTIAGVLSMTKSHIRVILMSLNNS